MEQEIADKIHEEVLDEINQTINDLQNQEKLTEEEKEKLEFYKKIRDEKKTPKEKLRDVYYDILDILESYMDLGEKEKKIIAIWVIGSVFYDNFNTFPYLYLNAMRGSGKTRLLKLISFLNDGILTTAPTESVIFRTKFPICLDEFERMDSKEKLLLKEMLNTAYKKGLFVLRNIKKKVLGQEQYCIERFETYRPICMANIWGMDDVLGDRCISIILEKSNNPIKTKKIECFDNDENMVKAKKTLFQCSLCGVYAPQGTYMGWNNYINECYNTTLQQHIQHITYTTLKTPLHIKILQDRFFFKIDKTGIDGRTLELMFPLFNIAYEIGDDVLEELLLFSKDLGKEKKLADSENKDVLLYKFISEIEDEEKGNFHSVKVLTEQFKNFLGEDNEEWINPRWFGRAIKRLNMVTQKRRIGYGVEVILDVYKAKNQSKIFEIKSEDNKKDV